MKTFPSFRATALLLAALAVSSASKAEAGILWYNGNLDLNDATLDVTNIGNAGGGAPFAEKSLVYDDFVVPVGQTWTITNLYGNYDVSANGTFSTATWQIRSGVSAGNGGTLVASGDSSTTDTTFAKPAGYSTIFEGTPTTITANLTSAVVLTAGTYWLALAPDDSTPYYSDKVNLLTTSGAGAIGTPPGNDGNSYITNNVPTTLPGNYNFTPTSSPSVEGAPTDYSEGVIGTFTTAAVPEPSSLLMAALGLGMAGCLKVRRARRLASN